MVQLPQDWEFSFFHIGTGILDYFNAGNWDPNTPPPFKTLFNAGNHPVWSLGFTFDDFSCVVGVAVERVWVKKPGEEHNIKSMMFLHPQSSICPAQSRSTSGQGTRLEVIKAFGLIMAFRKAYQDIVK